MAKPKQSTKKPPGGDLSKSKRPLKEFSYGEALSRLEEILQAIDEEQVDIDQLSGLVKEAADLVTLCRGKIQAAEVQVKNIAEQLEREVPDTTDDEEDEEDDE